MLGAIGCILVISLAMFCLWIGFSGMMVAEPAGGTLRTLAGFVGYFAVVAATIVAALRQ